MTTPAGPASSPATSPVASATPAGAARCHPARTTFLQIYLPNQTTPICLADKSTACAKPIRLLTIGVVRPGAGSTS